MKLAFVPRLALGVILCVTGFFCARSTPYRQSTVVLGPAGCRLVTDIVEPRSGEARGSVVLIHGLAANKKIMSYLAYGFAEAGLRVFVPDLPGHGRTQEPFSFAHAEVCSESLLRELIRLGAIEPARTILAGHSMGGGIAIRVAARVPVAGVIAISPAPMRPTHGIPATMLPFQNPPPTPANTLVISAALEPFGIRESARDLISVENVSSKYLLMPAATHVSVLFDARVAYALEEWAAEKLHMASPTVLPSSRMVIGSLAGFVGILLLAGPFLRELLGKEHGDLAAGERKTGIASATQTAAPAWRLLVEIAVTSLMIVVVLRFWNPLAFVRLFNGSYFASFLLLAGTALLLLHYKSVRTLSLGPLGTLVAAAFAGLAMHFLVNGWFDVTLTEAWLTAVRWARFPVMLVAAFAYLVAEEILLGQNSTRNPFRRLAVALALRLAAGVILIFGIFALHSGAILLFLLSAYLFVFSLFQRLGMDVVRKHTCSIVATALFGAILLTGFCLVIFPVS